MRVRFPWWPDWDWSPAFWRFSLKYWALPWFAFRWLEFRKDGKRASALTRLLILEMGYFRLAITGAAFVGAYLSADEVWIVPLFCIALGVFMLAVDALRAQAIYLAYGGDAR